MLNKLLKRRKYTLKNKLYIEAAYLNKTVFKEGTGIKYVIDYINKSVTVVATNGKARNHVSGVTQTRTQKVVPTIDLRRSDIKEFLKSVGELEVSVYEDKIIFSAIAKEDEELNEDALEYIDNNVIELSKYKSSKQVSFAVNIPSNKVVAGGESFNFKDLFSNTRSVFDAEYLKKKVIRVISLFSGCGMLDKGFLDHGGYDIKFAIDIFGQKRRLNGKHIETYRNNIGNHIVEGDVLDLTKDDIMEADFVMGGIPCVEFSSMNTKNNFRDRDDDEFPLLDRFLDVVKWSNAKGFLIENVKEFLSVKNSVLINRIKERLYDFNITYKVVNSTEYGSAQSRPRAIVLGIKNVMPVIEAPNIKLVRTVRDAFKGVENTPQHDVVFKLKDRYLEMAKILKPGQNLRHVPDELKPNRSFGNAIHRLHYDRPSPTITGTDSNYVIHPTEDRRISVAEIRRLFTIPDDYIFEGSATSIVSQLKNGVDYSVSSFLAKSIYEQMLPVL